MKMNIYNTEDIQKMSDQEFKSEITKIRKELFELRFKKATKQTIKTHLFKHTKNSLARLLTIRSQI